MSRPQISVPEIEFSPDAALHMPVPPFSLAAAPAPAGTSAAVSGRARACSLAAALAELNNLVAFDILCGIGHDRRGDSCLEVVMTLVVMVAGGGCCGMAVEDGSVAGSGVGNVRLGTRAAGGVGGAMDSGLGLEVAVVGPCVGFADEAEGLGCDCDWRGDGVKTVGGGEELCV